MIEDKNGAYYIGSTNNVAKRFEAHSNGVGAKYLNGRVPLKLVFVKEYRYYKNALIAEKRIKKYTRGRKQELIKIYDQKIQ